MWAGTAKVTGSHARIWGALSFSAPCGSLNASGRLLRNKREEAGEASIHGFLSFVFLFLSCLFWF